MTTETNVAAADAAAYRQYGFNHGHTRMSDFTLPNLGDRCGHLLTSTQKIVAHSCARIFHLQYCAESAVVSLYSGFAYASVVQWLEPQPSKLMMWVRLPSLAQTKWPGKRSKRCLAICVLWILAFI